MVSAHNCPCMPFISLKAFGDKAIFFLDTFVISTRLPLISDRTDLYISYGTTLNELYSFTKPPQ